MFMCPMIDMDLTGRNIRNKMEQAGVTVKEVKDALGLSYQSVYYWLDGKTVPSVDSLYGLSLFLGVSMDELIVGIHGKDSYPPENRA